MSSSQAEPRFFLDRGLGSVLIATGLRERGWLVTTMDERYGTDVSQSVADIDWIREASERGECLLTKDAAIARNAVEAEIVYNCDARVFALTNAKLTGPVMLSRFLLHEGAVFRWAARTRPPFVLGLDETRVRRLKLNLP